MPALIKKILIYLACGLTSVAYAQEGSSNSGANTPPTFHMTGSAELLSHYVEHGLSQTNKNPALQGSFWFNFGPQARIGLWGSNVSFENESVHLVLKPSAEVKVIFSQNADLIIGYSNNQYFSSTSRNGNTTYFNLTMFGYRVKYELISNWEGTSSSSTYMSLGKTFDVLGNWKWSNDIGYSTLKADGYQNYFDLKSMLGYKFTQIFVQGGLTATSTTASFNGRGGYYTVLSASVTF